MVTWFHLTFRCNLSLCASQSMSWPLWPPAWDCYHHSSLELVLHRLHQMHHGPEPWKNKLTYVSAQTAIRSSNWHFDIMSRCAVPEKCYVFARNFLQFIEWGSLPCKAVVGVVVCHDGGGANLAQFVLWTVQTAPHCMQVVLPPVPH